MAKQSGNHKCLFVGLANCSHHDRQAQQIALLFVVSKKNGIGKSTQHTADYWRDPEKP